MCLIKYQSNTTIHDAIQWKCYTPKIPKTINFVEFEMGAKILLISYRIGSLMKLETTSNILKELMVMFKIYVKVPLL